MPDTLPFATDILLVSAGGLIVLLAHRLSAWVRVPASALVLVTAAVAFAVAPDVHRPSQTLVSRVVTVALVAILFAGGMGIGERRFRPAAGPILSLGIVGTFATAGLAAVFVHFSFGFGWYVSALVATAVAPTDPAVVFSVMGRHRVAGRSGTIVEGESGANDPVGIALMSGLIGAHGLSVAGVGHVASIFGEQMAIGGGLGLMGGWALVRVTSRFALPTPALEPLRTLAVAFLIYGVTTLARGSGFLAVFTAGVVIGDSEAPFKRETDVFHAALGSVGEMVAFVALGFTVDLHVMSRFDVWGPGLALGAVLAAVLRPLVAAACLAPSRLTTAERRFVQFAGLKGAVPILLGGYLLGTSVTDPPRLYGIVIVVVVFSVVVQGGLAAKAVSVLRLPLEP